MLAFSLLDLHLHLRKDLLLLFPKVVVRGVWYWLPPFPLPPKQRAAFPRAIPSARRSPWFMHTHWLWGPSLSAWPADRQLLFPSYKQQLGLDQTRRVILFLLGLDVLPGSEERRRPRTRVSPMLPASHTPQEPVCTHLGASLRSSAPCSSQVDVTVNTESQPRGKCWRKPCGEKMTSWAAAAKGSR